MKIFLVMALIAGLAIAPSVMAQTMDYSKMSTDQLFQLKNQGVAPQDQAAFNMEWTKRVANMNLDQLTEYQVTESEQKMAKRQLQEQPMSSSPPGR